VARDANYMLIPESDGTEAVRVVRPRTLETIMTYLERFVRDSTDAPPVAPAAKSGVPDTLYVMLFRKQPGAKRTDSPRSHLLSIRIEPGKHFSVLTGNGLTSDGGLQLEGVIADAGGRLHAEVRVTLSSVTGEFKGLIQADSPFAACRLSDGPELPPLEFLVTTLPLKYLQQKQRKQEDDSRCTTVACMHSADVAS